ncbi:MAG: purine-nucleoside phosphorylase [Lachnospiraceae bacterium]|nr:purine-nucleoside phosphorylase [Lachnospiraceae bacterium]
MSDPRYEKLCKCVECVRSKTDFKPLAALVLGSGLGAFAEDIDIDCIIKYNEIEGFPVSTVAGHKGQFVFCHVNNIPLVIMQGRVHYYEGYSISDVVLPIRLMGMLGAKYLFLTNASGGMGDGYKVGDLMLIKDHISIFAPNPLIGPNIDELGLRFPDMSDIYNTKLRNLAKSVAAELSVELKEGVYVQLTGPSYESPAEIQMLKAMGADAVGMSTVVEAICANHMGMEVCGISCVSNLAAGISKEKLKHEDIQEAVAKTGVQFKKLIFEIISRVEGLS